MSLANGTAAFVFLASGREYSNRDNPVTSTVTATEADSAGPLFLPVQGNQIWTEGAAIAALELPAATGGTPPLAYTLTGTLPEGLTYDANARTISGTPPAA